MNLRSALVCVLCWSALALPASVHAQSKPAAREPAIEDLLPLANDPDDPIGLDRDHEGLDHPNESGQAQAPAANGGKKALDDDARRFGPTPPPTSARTGEVLRAVPTVHEREHRVDVRLELGLAFVHEEIVFASTADKPAELELRVAVPDGAALAALRVCNANGCRDGAPDPSRADELSAYDDAVQARGDVPIDAALPAAQAREQRDHRGLAITLRAAPVTQSRPLTVLVDYVLPALLHGGVVRLRLPARGMDPRIVPLEITLHAEQLTGAKVGDTDATEGAVQQDPSSGVSLTARAAPDSGISSGALRFECGGRSCIHTYAAAAPAAREPVDLVLAIDASPSMEGFPRSRLLSAIAAIIADIPGGSLVRALMYAGQTSPLLSAATNPDAVPLRAFQAATFDVELGSATRFEAAWATIDGWGWSKGARKKLVVIVGDGGLTTGTARPFAAARRAGVEVSAVNLGNRRADSGLLQGVALARGIVVDAGNAADSDMHGLGSDELEERVAALFSRAMSRVELQNGARSHLVSALRAGESLSFDVELDPRARGSVRYTTNDRSVRVLPAKGMLALTLAARASSERGGVLALTAVDPRDLAHARGDRPPGQAEPAKKLPAPCDRRGPAQRHGGLSFDLVPVALAYERARCLALAPKAPAQTEPDLGAGMPGSPLLSMLRQRILPVARGCFRRDRAGRPDYQVRAVFTFRLADREIVSAQIEGQIEPELRSCLLSAVDTLAVPRFSGVVNVRYPLVTERETLPAQIQLTTQTAGTLDAVIEDRPARAR